MSMTRLHQSPFVPGSLGRPLYGEILLQYVGCTYTCPCPFTRNSLPTDTNELPTFEKKSSWRRGKLDGFILVEVHRNAR